MQYNLISHDEFQNITVFESGQMYVASQDHPAFQRIVAGVVAGDVGALKLFDIQESIRSSFEKVSDRVSIRNGIVYLDSEEIHSSLTDHILRFYDEDGDFMPLVRFMENIEANPQENSRTQLFNWLKKRDFTINEDGHIIAYKGVRTINSDNGETKYESISHGKAIVDGVEYEGAIPNYAGAVVEMPRGEVAFDPNVACHTGLHAGNWRYANSFAQGATLTVAINPRDVVSVPRDSNSEKIRVCRYTVLEVVDQPYNSAFIRTDVSDDVLEEEDDYSYGCDCGSDYDGYYCEYDDVENSGFVDQSVFTNPTVIDTTQNYKAQKRDAHGRFIKG